MVKGLAKLDNRLHHDREIKYVDASTVGKCRQATPQ